MENDGSVAPGAGRTDEWLSLLEQYRVEVAVLSARENSHGIWLMRSQGAWEVCWQDEDIVVLGRVPSGGDPRLPV
jgi:hypothetical protein